MSIIDTLNHYDTQHVMRMLRSEQEIGLIFNEFAKSVSKELRKWNEHNLSNVWLRNSAVEKSIDKKLTNLASVLEDAITQKQEDAWASANLKNDEIAAQFIQGMSLSSIVKDGMFRRNMDALKALQKRTYNGMNLSQRVWSITKQTKGNIELFLEGGIATGRSAEAIGRDLRQMLVNPDKRFRRVRNEQGKLVLSQPMKDYHPGAGVYRSSRMNALRVAATETNMGYRVADSKRWEQLGFVLGFEVNRTRNAKPCAICDALVGKYPTDFVFPGWHPFCLCFATPIVMEHKDFADYLLNGKIPQDKIIRDIPESAKEWIKEHEEKGLKEPLFVKTNKDFLNKPIKQKRIKTDAEKADIQKRWNKRVLTNKHTEHLNEIKKIYGKESKSISALINSIKKDIKAGKSINSVDALVKKLDHKVDIKIAWDERVEVNHLEKLLVDVKQLKEMYTISEIKAVYGAVESKLKQWEHLTLEQQEKKLDYEIDWVEKNKKYSTWKIAQDAYKKEFANVQHKVLEVEVDKVIDGALLLKAKSTSNLAKLLANKEVSQAYIDKVHKEVDTLVKRRNWARGTTSGEVDLPILTKKEIDKLLSDFLKEDVSTADGRYRESTKRLWAGLTHEERLTLTKYTQTFNYLNEPLRGLPYYGVLEPNAEHIKDLPILTKVLSQVTIKENTVVRRGVKDFTIKEIGKNLSDIQPGDEFTDKGFLSTAVHKVKGFTSPYEMIIVVPKGAQGVYAEPFSRYTDNNKFSYLTGELWDGKSNEPIMSEQEWIGQRGSRFKVLKRAGKKIYMQMIGQLK